MRRCALAAPPLACAIALAGCGGGHHGTTQAVARVDGHEITVLQLGQALAHTPGVRADNQEAASRAVLERLIDLQVLVDQAAKDKLDQDPGVRQALDAVRRELLARAWLEQVGQAAPPTDDAIRRFYDDNDALFTHRRIYAMHSLLATVPDALLPDLKTRVGAGADRATLGQWFAEHHLAVAERDGERPAEDVPLPLLKALATLPDGHGVMVNAGDHVEVMFVDSSTVSPVSFEQARPRIVAALTRQAREQAARTSLQAVKTGAKIEYLGAYAALGAASAPALPTSGQLAASAAQSAASAGADPVRLPASASADAARVSLPASDAQPQVRVDAPAPAADTRVHLPAASTATDRH